MLQPVLVGFALFLLGEVLLFALRRVAPRLVVGFLLHATVVLLALRVGLGLTDWAVSDPRALRFLTTALLLAGTLALYALVDALVFQRPGPDDRARVPALPREVGRVLVFLAAFLYALSAVHGTPLTTVVVSSTVLSAVLGLALQDVLKNVFAGIAMQIEGTPHVGDWLSIDGTAARVVELSWRTTRMRTNEGHYLIEPNARLSELRLVNYGSGRLPVAFSFQVGLAYEAPPAQAKAALLAAARSAPGSLADPPPQATIRAYGDSAITYELRVWTHDVDRLTVFRDGVFSRVWYELHRAGLDVPFPIRTVHMHDAAADRGERNARERERVAELLAGLDLFHGVAREVLVELARAARKLYFDDRERLFREGDEGDSLFVVDRGQVVVSKAPGVSGTVSVQLAILGAGSFFGEMSLLTGEPRSATVTSDGGCEVLVLTKADLAPLLASDPALADVLSRALAERNAATEAALAARRERRSRRLIETDHGSILKKVREFFRLPGS